MLNHTALLNTALLNERKANWEACGYDVGVEGQNSFRPRGKAATLAGKPDLIPRRDDEAVIVAAKTGQESPSHAVQVMIYLYAIPKVVDQYRNRKLSGQVTYPDRTIRIPAEVVEDQFVRNLVALIRRRADDNPATRVPSARECRFCDITAADCPVRVDGDGEPRPEIPSNSEAQQSPNCRLPALARPLNARIDLGEPNQRGFHADAKRSPPAHAGGDQRYPGSRLQTGGCPGAGQ